MAAIFPFLLYLKPHNWFSFPNDASASHMSATEMLSSSRLFDEPFLKRTLSQKYENELTLQEQKAYAEQSFFTTT